jgi:spore germination protein GerM
VSIRWLVTLAGLVALTTVAAGCGLPVNSSPQAIPSNEIPVALSEPNSTVPGFLRVHNTVPVPIYLLAGTDLTKTYRYLRPPLKPQEVLDALEAGPSPVEYDQGIQSAVPAGADLVAGVLSAGVLIVVLDPTFTSLLPGQAPYYFAQIVYSVTSLSDIDGVVFEYNGAIIQPVLGDGSIATNFAENYVVHRSDYEQLAP